MKQLRLIKDAVTGILGVSKRAGDDEGQGWLSQESDGSASSSDEEPEYQTTILVSGRLADISQVTVQCLDEDQIRRRL